ncbi:MAG: helix-turn-helix domain-containing protein [Armatimonadetes bacterium]|nr:helix-turn-helix domain-containing protein [Armatimonadota bacterium]
MAKLAERQQARLLRQQGWSIKTIAKNLGVSKSSVSLWVHDIALTVEQREFIESETSQLRRERARQTRLAREEMRREREREKARELYEQFKNEPLFMAGLVGYWAEGSKTDGYFRVANTDPCFLKLMMDWLMRYCGVKLEDFTLSVYMHSDLGVTEMECRQFWEERLGLPITYLYWKANKGYNYRRRRSYFGTAYLKVRRSKMLLEYVKEWIQCLNKEIVSERA